MTYNTLRYSDAYCDEGFMCAGGGVGSCWSTGGPCIWGAATRKFLNSHLTDYTQRSLMEICFDVSKNLSTCQDPIPANHYSPLPCQRSEFHPYIVLLQTIELILQCRGFAVQCKHPSLECQ